MPIGLTIEIFRARIEARCVRFAVGGADLGELIDGIERAATAFVAEICEAYGGESTFTAACREADAKAAKRTDQRERSTEVRAATLAAAEYLVREGDSKRLHEWLDQHSPKEALAIIEHIKGYRKKREAQQCPT
jgi:hypothetical protein